MEGVMRGRSARADELKTLKLITRREVSKDGNGGDGTAGRAAGKSYQKRGITRQSLYRTHLPRENRGRMT